VTDRLFLALLSTLRLSLSVQRLLERATAHRSLPGGLA
jgi:hypothetical protein